METGFSFGGVGESGMGCVHGKRGFDELSHLKPIYTKFPYDGFPMNVRFPPLTTTKRLIQDSSKFIKTPPQIF